MVDVYNAVETDWDYLMQFFPPGWEQEVKEQGLLKYGRTFKGDDGPSRLLRVLLIHIAGNLSLRVTSSLAAQGGIAEISDVGILKRLKKSCPWFTWATNRLLEHIHPACPLPQAAESYNFRFVDASIIEEPGATGSNWRLHYSLNAATLAPDEITVGDYRRGEKLSNFTVSPGDVMIGDRAYGTRSSIHHAHSSGGYVIMRASPHQLPMHDTEGQPFQLRRRLRKLKTGEVGEYQAIVKFNGIDVLGRVCAIKKTKAHTAEAQKKIRRKCSKNGHKVQEDTLEYAGYVILFTTLPGTVRASEIMEIYRHRWQVELVFKRMKSLLKMAPLYKKSPDGMMGWLSGKLFVAVLIEYMIKSADSFFPWGYPLNSSS